MATNTLDSPVPGPHCGAHASPRAAVNCGNCRVRHLALCSAVPGDALAPLEAAATTMHLEPGATLVREHDPRKAVYTVTAGALRLVRLLPDGRRRVAGFRLPGDFIGLSNSGHHRHDIEAVSSAEVCRFRVEDMARLRSRFPALDAKLLSIAMAELDAARDDALGLSRLDPGERLAAFLLALSEKRRRWHVDPKVIVLPMGRADIADFLGLTIETVSRSFTRLRRDGAIGLPDPNTVEVADRDLLARVARGEAG